ncbi:MAG: DUF3078 domain-containing protein [Chitinophagaceae bacterium]|nr:DUF3078 domain-containing protein [Chitinophagaceae bacterium]
MKRILGLLAITLLGLQLNAQDASVKEIQNTTSKTVKVEEGKKPNKNGWIRGANLSFGLTQIGNKNWVAAGGDEFSLSAAASLNAFATRTWGRYTWENALDVNYGLVNTSTLGVRKVNDRLDLLSKYSYKPKKWKNTTLTLLGQLRSQITSGYQYDYFGTTEKRRNSGFFAPAYVIVSPGIEWKPNSWFSLFGSPLSARWVIVSNGAYSYAGQGGIFNDQEETPLATLYGVNPAKGHRGEFGAFVTATIKKDIFKNTSYYSKLDLYSNYIKGPQNVDVFWTNQFKVRLAKWLNVNYQLDMLYDDDVKNPKNPSSSIGLQLLSTFGIGVSFKM